MPVLFSTFESFSDSYYVIMSVSEESVSVYFPNGEWRS